MRKSREGKSSLDFLFYMWNHKTVILVIKKQLEFNIEKERERIERCFSKKGFEKTKVAMHEIVNLFEKRQWENCIAKINELGKNEIDECDEVEYVSTFIYDFLCNIYPSFEVE